MICMSFRMSFRGDNHYSSSRSEVFCKKGVLRNFVKFTGKHLCQSLFFNKVTGLRPASLLEKRLCHRCFPVNFAKFLRTSFLAEQLRWLLLSLLLHKCQKEVNFLKFSQWSLQFSHPICSQLTLSLPPEYTRKPYGFLMFSGGQTKGALGTIGLNFSSDDFYTLKSIQKSILSSNVHAASKQFNPKF